MGARQHITATQLKTKWYSDDATGMTHDHQTGEVVVTMSDGSEWACTFAEHAAFIAGDDA